tara:strand:+ start:19707 stop:19991 length:285 start_codon:yes stop_codon:yes gene_type:complete
MAFVSTIENRPNILGNLVLVSGTFTNGGADIGGAITLTDHLSSIVALGASAGGATAGTGAGVDGTFALKAPAGVGLVIQTVAGQDGTWWALGKR